jgi:hypothetical protein
MRSGQLRDPMLVAGNLVLVAAGMLVDGLLFTLTLYTQRVLGCSAIRFGVITAMLPFGLGMGCAYVAGTVASLQDVPEQDSGIAAGLQNISFGLGTTLGVAALSTVAAARELGSRVLTERGGTRAGDDYRLAPAMLIRNEPWVRARLSSASCSGSIVPSAWMLTASPKSPIAPVRTTVDPAPSPLL